MQFSLFRPLLLWLPRLAALFLLLMWTRQSVIPTFNRTDTQRDMVLYYRAARNAGAGHALYTPRPDYGPDSKPFEYLYPPPFAAAIAPLGRLPFLAFARLWTVGLVMTFLGFALCLMLLSGRADAWNFVCWLALLCVFPGAARALSLGQIDPLLWLLSALSVWAIALPSNRSRALGGALLGVASLVKIYAAWPLFALQKGEGRARIWMGAGAVAALGVGLGIVVCGADSYRQWAHAVTPIAGQGTFNPDNYSFSMGVLRIAQMLGWNYAGGPLTGLPKLWLNLAAIGGPLLSLLASRRLSLRWRVALITVAAAWCAPLCWSTYLPLALVPCALAVRAWKDWRNPEAGAQVETVEENLN